MTGFPTVEPRSGAMLCLEEFAGIFIRMFSIDIILLFHTLTLVATGLVVAFGVACLPACFLWIPRRETGGFISATDEFCDALIWGLAAEAFAGFARFVEADGFLL